MLKDNSVYSNFVGIVKKYMTEKNCNKFIESLDKLFPSKTPEITSVILGKQCGFCITWINIEKPL